MSYFFFLNDTATTRIYTLSLHDALPIFAFERGIHAMGRDRLLIGGHEAVHAGERIVVDLLLDRKSTRLNSSHANISYAVFCLKKKIAEHQDLHVQRLVHPAEIHPERQAR